VPGVLRSDPANHPVEPSVLENDADVLAWLFGQSKLLRLLLDLILVPAKEASGHRYRPAVDDFVRQVTDIHFGPGLP
jgi:hypothetical protein